MLDLLSWSIPLGRWLGTRVRLHVFLALFASGVLLEAAWRGPSRGQSMLETAGWLALLVLALTARAAGHVVLSYFLEWSEGEIRLWPLGNLAGPAHGLAARSPTRVFLAGIELATSLALALGAAIGLAMAGAHLEFNPFGGPRGGAPTIADGGTAVSFSALWWLGWFGYLNWVLFMANLIPVLPFDCGRMLRAGLGDTYRDNESSPYLARALAVALGLVGIFRFCFSKPGGIALILMALVIEWMVWLEARMIEESGYLDEGLFGYDFSQGYTSLDVSPSTARPKKQNALRRWRQRRSKLRRERREAQEAAESARMDEILEKLHKDGRAALSDEEHRFLIRVSAKYRSRRV